MGRHIWPGSPQVSISKLKIVNIDYLYRDANHSDFCGIVQIFKVDFPITILKVYIRAIDDFKMVPDKITGATLTSTPVIP